MNRHVSGIAGRLSLRPPQRTSLEILARVLDVAAPSKEVDLARALEAVAAEYPTVTDFEREFPSLCFALATGVGKTRLMGAFVAYLYLTGRSRHFFVLAPNLTIYNKLIADFTPGSPKYVFKGLSEFVTAPPVVITGENYESGIGVRNDQRRGQLAVFQPGGEDAVHVNVFNISKINTEVRASQRGNQPPRIKRLAEYIGESYFEYLARLPDLVLLMDESHRYRADAGTRAINELKPILGLELTATPFTESPKGPVAFKNVAYSYPLAEAIRDGFVKEPAVATRRDFDVRRLGEEQVERIKLEDGVRLHEQVKTDLQIYAAQRGGKAVKPFMLVIARDTEHAGQLVGRFKSETFFGGRYAGKTIEVHSALSGDEKEDTVRSLLAVESPDEPTEIVIHVNMLKEGWDVTNLYTIVPLRAANARTLIEQSIGRGLRLPYGRRTGVPAVDRLTIVAHDKFQEIVDEARRGDSIIRRIQLIELDPDGPGEPERPTHVPPVFETVLAGLPHPAPVQIPGLSGPAAGGTGVAPRYDPGAAALPARLSPFSTPAAQAIARAVAQAIPGHEGLRSAADLNTPEVQARIVEEVKASLPAQGESPGAEDAPNVEEIVARTTAAYEALSIDVPTVVVVPTGEVTIEFEDFDLDTSGVHLQPVREDILIQHLQSHHQERLSVVGDGPADDRLEDYVVRALIEFDDVEYDANAGLLYKLAERLVGHLRSYLASEEDVRNVLLYYQKRLGDLVHAQMARHRREYATGYEAKVTRGFSTLKAATWSVASGESARPFRDPVEDKKNIRRMLFEGFRKCLFPLQRFDSDPERRFAVVLENDDEVLKWFKPAAGNLPIHLEGGERYEPDFVVEIREARFLCEVKARNEMDDDLVQQKARAAVAWCRHATEHTRTTDGKPWRYLLVPDDAITEAGSLAGFAAGWERK